MSNSALPSQNTSPISLRKNALGLRHAVVISVAVMSPAASVFFNTIVQAGQVGAAIPLCYLIGFVVALLVANQYSEFAREIPSSGSAYTFVTEGLGLRWGFITGWIGLLAIAIGVPYSFVLLSANIQTLLARWLGVHLSWPFWFVLAVGLAAFLCYWGVRESMNVDLAFLAFEMAVCVVLAIIVLFHVGQQDGLTALPFTFNGVPHNGSIVVGVVLGVLSYIGFETAAALGEETRDPHKNIPRAVLGSMLVVGVFYVLMAYVGTVGYGVHNIANGYANDAAPFDTIARHVGSPLLVILIDIVGILSFFSAALAIINGGARILYAVGRDGLLPSWFSWLHPTRHTPVGAITLLCIFGLVVGLLLGLIMTPIVAFGFLGTLDALAVLLIYGLVSVACVRFFWKKRRFTFHWLRHGIMPLLSTLIIVGIFGAIMMSPGDPPLDFVPLVLVGWLAIGGVLMVLQRL